jgi:hypothetical protein
MVARLLTTLMRRVDLCARAQKHEVQAKASFPAERFGVDPEGIDALPGMKSARGVDPSLLEQALIRIAGLRLHHRIKSPRPRVVALGTRLPFGR